MNDGQSAKPSKCLEKARVVLDANIGQRKGHFGIWVGAVCGIFVLSMGALDEGHFIAELENGVKLDSIELSSEEEPATTAIEDAVKVLLHGLGRILTEKVLENAASGCKGLSRRNQR
ncbi:hypothetical protein FNV43_RR18498 [Rhamnella rubrinervis]|uniref:Uncharacterized protein n=1 Tax=Rhamnella rubrinervis TaxID=2594499 RepID=A0A8K0GY28_9ROSA|nr:hypothetical protein FNV43_RR18498 [Rhamnella rubrinervis]